MTFFIYENWHAGAHKAVIHSGSCRFCNEGTGLSGQGTRLDRGKWHGPFKDIVLASESAERTGGQVSTHNCIKLRELNQQGN